MRTNEEKQLVTQALDALASTVEGGESEQLKAYLATLARFHRYSVGNVLLIGLQRPNATRVAGVRAWNKLGRHVRQGEKGLRIMAPIVWRKRKDDKPDGGKGDDAEAVAFVVCQAIGLEAVNAAADYIRLYQGSKETLLESLQRIRQAAVEIIGAIMGRDEARGKASDTEWQAAGAGEHQAAHAA